MCVKLAYQQSVIRPQMLQPSLIHLQAWWGSMELRTLSDGSCQQVSLWAQIYRIPRMSHACICWDGTSQKVILEILESQLQLVANDMKTGALPPWCLCCGDHFVDSSTLSWLLQFSCGVYLLLHLPFSGVCLCTAAAPVSGQLKQPDSWLHTEGAKWTISLDSCFQPSFSECASTPGHLFQKPFNNNMMLTKWISGWYV